MAIEIERKFLVLNDSWKASAKPGISIKQGYLAGSENASVRIRIQDAAANINIKSATLGIRRDEFEYAIPLDEANYILQQLCQKPVIEKIRYLVMVEQHEWEIDVFEGENQGLVVAEVELTSEDEEFYKPDWLGPDVSDDPRYYNTCLVSHPYKDW